MYTTRPWTMRQYAGFGTAAESNARYHQLLAAGTMGLSVAFDLPTQMGYDSDDPIAHGEVGKVGRGDRLDRRHAAALRRHPARQGLHLDDDQRARLGAAAALPARRRGARACRRSALNGTIQNDILKEYIARGTYIFPPKPSLRLVADTFAYCRAEIPKWNTISISGYHMAEAGATPVQEIAFTLANGIEYVRAAIAAGLAVDDFAPRLSFFFVARTTLLEEVAKFRAARRIWARIMRDEFGAQGPEVADAAVPHPDRRRAAHRPAARGQPGPGRGAGRWARCSAAPSRCTPTRYDEAIALPTEKAARLALRTQQVLAYETDLTATVDPFAGSYVVEAMTDEIEAAAVALMERVVVLRLRGRRDRGRASRSSEIETSAYRIAQEIDSGERVVVGLNRFTVDEEEPYEPLRVDPAIEAAQAAAAGRDPRVRGTPRR